MSVYLVFEKVRVDAARFRGNTCIQCRKHVDSALAHDFRDFEIIAVNDGSIDSTNAILATYASQVRVIDQNNQGSRSA